MVMRTKVISEPTELVPLLRALSSAVKKNVYEYIAQDWRLKEDIEGRFGDEGIEALTLFEKIKLVETRWQETDAGVSKAFRSYYSNFHLNTNCTVKEMGEILLTAAFPERKFVTLEDTIFEDVGVAGAYAGDVAEKFNLTLIQLKGLMKRSTRLEYKGQRIQRLTEPII